MLQILISPQLSLEILISPQLSLEILISPQLSLEILISPQLSLEILISGVFDPKDMTRFVDEQEILSIPLLHLTFLLITHRLTSETKAIFCSLQLVFHLRLLFPSIPFLSLQKLLSIQILKDFSEEKIFSTLSLLIGYGTMMTDSMATYLSLIP